MTEIIVRALDEDAWAEYRAIRLAALKESPEAFVATHEEESALDEASVARADAPLPSPGGRAGGDRSSASSASAGPAPRRTTPASSSACG